MYNFQLKQIYSFDVWPVPILGNNFKNVTVLALLDAESANQQGLDTQALHVQVYPHLPSGTPNRPTDYNYLKIRLSSGETTILGLPWIKDNTVVLVESSTITVKIGDVSPSDVTAIREALIQNGFNSLEISVE